MKAPADTPREFLGKCDAPRCATPAEVTNKFGARYCRGHAYLAVLADTSPPTLTEPEVRGGHASGGDRGRSARVGPTSLKQDPGASGSVSVDTSLSAPGAHLTEPLRVLVCGSRSWSHALEQRDIIADRLRALPAGSVVFHGGAKGVDRTAGRIAADLGYTVEPPHRPEWNTYGRRAGILRNNAMLDTNPDLVLAFWDGSSRGTKHTIEEARRRGIHVEVELLP